MEKWDYNQSKQLYTDGSNKIMWECIQWRSDIGPDIAFAALYQLH